MQRLSRFRDSTSQNSRTTHALIIFIFFSKNGPLIGKNSQLRSRSLDSLAACKFSSHSSEHRRRSYELCILAQIGMHGMQNNHVIPLSHGSRGARARCRSSQPASLGLLRTRFSRKTRWNSSEVSVLSRMSTSAWRERPNAHNRFARLGGRDPFPKRLQAGDY